MKRGILVLPLGKSSGHHKMEPHGQSPSFPRNDPQGANIPYQRTNPSPPQAQRTLRGCSYDPIGRQRLDHKFSPCLRRGFGRQASGNKFQVAFHGYGTAKNACSETKESFLFGDLSPPNKKMTSLRPRRLCGENSILDKNDFTSK